MTEKRFKWCKRTDIEYVDEFVVDTFTNKELDEEDMCDKLNELASEIERLKHECALYCYMVSFYNYSDSEFIPIFHEKKYTKEEFQKICNEIKAKILEAQENVWSWQYPDRFIEYAKEYGFKEIDVLEVETIGFKVTTYGCMECIVDCLDCKNAIRHYDDYSEIADITCQKNGKLIQNGMCGHCKDYEEVQEE